MWLTDWTLILFTKAIFVPGQASHSYDWKSKWDLKKHFM